MKYFAPVSKCLAFTASSSLLLCLATGCSSTGGMSGQTGTQVQLTHNNYKVITPAPPERALGSNSWEFFQSFLPITRMRSRICTSQSASLTGKAVALANQTEDRSTLYLILFSVPRVTITADVVEFTDQPSGQLTVSTTRLAVHSKAPGRTGALHDLRACGCSNLRQVMDCGGPPPLFAWFM